MFKINILTKGFKFNKPTITDMLFDARILPNPFYVKELKNKTGLDTDVFNYVINNDTAYNYLEKIINLIDYYVGYRKHKHNSMTITIACTGGQHRSVAVAEYLKNNLGYDINVVHTDLEKVNTNA